MGKFYVYTSRASKGARVLAKALGGKRVKVMPALTPSDTIINWGDSQCPSHPSVMNNPSAIRTVANKLLAFQAFAQADVSIPRFVASAADVNWNGATVVRHKLTGHSGEGIEIVEPGGTLPSAPLYVEYVKKEDEYRIHVGRRSGASIIISTQRKARNKSVENPNWQVRNHANGFVFVRQDVNAPQSVRDAAVAALEASGLDFGAVDVIYNKQQGKAYVLEINTAPGLEGTTIADYANFFRGVTQ
jgi:glutathione synthase/RimK-type ligase-like ATP-grasp enzyme